MRKTLPGAQRQGRDKESGKRRNLIRAAWKRNGHPRRGACQAPVGALSVSDTACRVAVKSAFFIDAWPDGATLPPRAFCLFQWQTLLSACAGRGERAVPPLEQDETPVRMRGERRLDGGALHRALAIRRMPLSGWGATLCPCLGSRANPCAAVPSVAGSLAKDKKGQPLRAAQRGKRLQSA